MSIEFEGYLKNKTKNTSKGKLAFALNISADKPLEAKTSIN
jgi:hypothetical protein